MIKNHAYIDPRVVTEEVINNEALLVDVRDKDEWINGHAKNAIHLPLDRIADGEVPTKNKSKVIYLYCASGNRSAVAAQLLDKKGYDAVNIGGFTYWQAAGGEVAS